MCYGVNFTDSFCLKYIGSFFTILCDTKSHCRAEYLYIASFIIVPCRELNWYDPYAANLSSDTHHNSSIVRMYIHVVCDLIRKVNRKIASLELIVTLSRLSLACKAGKVQAMNGLIMTIVSMQALCSAMYMLASLVNPRAHAQRELL